MKPSKQNWRVRFSTVTDEEVPLHSPWKTFKQASEELLPSSGHFCFEGPSFRARELICTYPGHLLCPPSTHRSSMWMSTCFACPVVKKDAAANSSDGCCDEAVGSSCLAVSSIPASLKSTTSACVHMSVCHLPCHCLFLLAFATLLRRFCDLAPLASRSFASTSCGFCSF